MMPFYVNTKPEDEEEAEGQTIAQHIPHTGVANIKKAGFKDSPEALIASSQEQMLRSMSRVGTSVPWMERKLQDGNRGSKVVENEAHVGLKDPG